MIPSLLAHGRDLEECEFWRQMPTVPEDLERVYRAWHDLAGSRHDGGPTPFEAADRYAERLGIDDFETFWELIQAMDRVIQEWRTERRRKEASGRGH